MYIDLDSKDLILLERDEGLIERVKHLFVSAQGSLVLSAPVINEIIEPLRRQGIQSSVMTLLNRIESIPHTWIRTAELEDREIEHATRCYLEGRDYGRVSPFVSSYVDTLVGLDATTASYYRERSLAETIWDQLHGEQTVPTLADPTISHYQTWVTQNRSLIRRWSDSRYQAELKEAFRRKIANILARSPSLPPVSVDIFTEFLWEHPCWCPATRLDFEIVHVFLYDRQTRPTHTDLEDFSRLRSLPYVDVVTCDGVKRDYLRRLRTSDKYRLHQCEYWSRCKIAANIDEVIALLKKVLNSDQKRP